MPRSRVTLPHLESPPATIAEYMISRFPHVSEPAWRDRFSRGLITIGGGVVLREDAPYRHGLLVFYEREVPQEPEPPETETILYRDAEILVADKPHGMPVTPAGEYAARSLLARLERSTGLDTLAPLHRLDRDTAGIVLFSLNVASRARYHELFATRVMAREYLAIARVQNVPEQKHWLIENRIGAGTPWFRRQIIEGPVNAITEIDLIQIQDRLGRFRLRPKTGKKHQLRIHMAAIGFPILGDPLYPDLHESLNQQPGSDLPLQLLASSLSFTDPLSGVRRDFMSARNLQQ